MKIKIRSLFFAFIILSLNAHTAFAANLNNTYVGSWLDYAQNISEGTGSRSQPYKISKPEHLSYIAKKVNSGTTFKGCYFILCNNIDLGGKEWIAIGSSGEVSHCKFCGTIDGANMSISNLKVDKRNQSAQGLFGYIESAEIKNIKLCNCSINGKSDVGGIAGYSYLSSISNCAVDGIVNGQENVGAICGRVYRGSIKQSASSAKANGIFYAGGIAGNISRDSVVDECYSLGEVCGSGCIGGLIGININSLVKNCFSRANIVSKTYAKTYVGGLIGSNCGKLKNSFSASLINFEADLNSKTYIPGLLVGNNSGVIKKTYYASLKSNSNKLKPIGQGDHSNASTGLQLNEKNTTKLMNSNKLFGIWGKDLWGMNSKINDGLPYLLNVPLIS